MVKEAPMKNLVVEVLISKDWDQATYHAQKGRIYSQRVAKVPNFYGDATKASTDVFALHVACQYKAPLSMIELLHSINPTAITTVDSVYKRTPLHLAAMQGASPKVVAFLLHEHTKAAAIPDALGRLPVHYSCKDKEHGELNTRLLLKAYRNGATKADTNGFLPLHVACRTGMPLETLRVLTGVAPQTIHAKTKKGSTPKSCAMQFEKNQVVMDLLDRCANSKDGPVKDVLDDGETLEITSITSFKSNETPGSKEMLEYSHYLVASDAT